MRKIDESRAANYIRKHSNYKKWLAFVLCLSLLTGTVTLYILNKPATAMTAEGADSIGAVLETLDSEGEAELIQDTLENKLAAEGEGSGEGGDGNLFDLGQGSGNNGEDGDDAAGGDGQNGDDAGDDGQDGDDAANLGDTEEAKDGQKSDDTALTEDKAAAEATSDEENKEETTEEDELTQDVVLTVSYVDENGESIADDKELSIEESFDPAKEAPSIEGYTFKEATFNSKAISKITVLKNESDIKYYEVTFDNDETKEIKKDGSIVLTYTAEEEDLVLTASYVDEDGKEIAEEEELEISESFDPKNDSDAIEGYTFKEAKIDEHVVVLITAKEDEESGEKFYEATLEDESVVEIKEDTTIILTYAAVDTTVVLTAKFVDRNGEEFQESKDLNIGDETELKKSKITEVDGYFFYKAIYEEKEITKIAPIFEEEKKDTDKDDAETETESESEESDEESAAVKATGYKFTTVDGEEIEITEDAEIELTFLKASTETEFTFSDGKVTVTATINGKNVFPEGIELKAVEVTKDSSSYNYDAYMDALNQNAEAIANEAGKDNADEFTEDNTLLYDIAFAFEEKEIQPKEGTVSVKIEFNKNQLSEDIAALSDEDIAVVHLPIKEEVKEENEITNTDEAKDISSGDIEVITLTDATAAVGEAEKVEFEADSFSIFAVLAYQNHEPGTDTFETVLGDAVNFGVIAKDFSQIEHAETNFAAIKFKQGGKTTGNDMTNPAEQTFIAAEIDGNIEINGQPIFFILPKGYEGQVKTNGKIVFDTSYSQDQLKGIIEDMLAYIKAASKDLATRHQSSYETIYAYGDQSKKGFDFSKYKDGTYYLNVDEKFIVDYMSQDDKLFIKKNPGQTIVFNVDYPGEINIHKYEVNNGDRFVDTATLEGTSQDPVARTLIWNFINASKVTTVGSVAGVFISGKDNALWENRSTSGGWVAFDNVSLPGNGEWHNTYSNIRQINGTAELQAYKTINGIGANVTGFTFTLYKQDATVEGGWKEIESKTNDPASPHSIVFSPITYGDDSRNTSNQYQSVSGDEETFTYKIVETQGALDINNNTYIADTREYYATVEVVKENYSQQAGRVVYRVSTPKYYYLDGGKVFELFNTTFLERDGVDEKGNPKYRKVDSNKLPVFNNKTSDKLSIRKEWKDMEGNDDENPLVTKLDVSILRRVVNPDGTFSEWDTFKKVQLTQNNNWTWSSETDNVAIDLVNEDGFSYQYTVKEDDQYLREFTVKYNYGGKDYLADLQGNLTWINENGKPVLTDAYLLEATEADYGVVTITNQRIVTNVLPSTGGMGDLPYMAAGAGTAMVGLLGTGLYYRKKKDDDQEEE